MKIDLEEEKNSVFNLKENIKKNRKKIENKRDSENCWRIAYSRIFFLYTLTRALSSCGEDGKTSARSSSTLKWERTTRRGQRKTFLTNRKFIDLAIIYCSVGSKIN